MSENQPLPAALYVAFALALLATCGAVLRAPTPDARGPARRFAEAARAGLAQTPMALPARLEARPLLRLTRPLETLIGGQTSVAANRLGPALEALDAALIARLGAPDQRIDLGEGLRVWRYDSLTIPGARLPQGLVLLRSEVVESTETLETGLTMQHRDLILSAAVTELERARLVPLGDLTSLRGEPALQEAMDAVLSIDAPR